MTGHHKEITDLSVHPSGKLALSTSRDSTLRIWDLIKGRCSYHNILAAVADGVSFSPDGTLYALLTGNQVTIHNIGEEEGLVASLQHSHRLLSMAWYTTSTLLTGTESGSIHAWDAKTGQDVGACKQAHKTRIRGLVVVPHRSTQGQSQDASVDTHAAQQSAEPSSPHQAAQQCLIASAASDGSVKAWRLDVQGGSDCLQNTAEIMTGARLTCLCLVQPAQTDAETAKALAHLKAKRRKAASLVKRSKPKAPGVTRDNMQKPKKLHKANVQARPKPDVEKVGIVHDGVVDFTAGSGVVQNRQQQNLDKQAGHKRKPSQKRRQ